MAERQEDELCVAHGRTYDDGRPADECPAICSVVWQMCEGCQAFFARRTGRMLDEIERLQAKNDELMAARTAATPPEET